MMLGNYKYLLMGMLSSAIPAMSQPERRTFKIRPTDYTKPMVASSDKEIAEWNRALDEKKLQRQLRKQRLRRRYR